MRNHSFAHQQETFLTAALVASTVLHQDKGFRPRDVQFFFELFTSFVYQGEHSYQVIQLTQINRILNFHKKNKRLVLKEGQKKSYLFTYAGTLVLLERLLEADVLLPHSELLFTQYFLKTYGPLIENYLLNQKKFLPAQKQEQFKSLLNQKTKNQKQMAKIQMLVKALNERKQNNVAISEYVNTQLKTQKNLKLLVKDLGDRFSYVLNFRKSLTDIFRTLDERVVTHEFTQGFLARNKLIYEPLEKYLNTRLELLKAYQSLIE